MRDIPGGVADVFWLDASVSTVLSEEPVALELLAIVGQGVGP